MAEKFTVDGEEFSLEKTAMSVTEILELAGRDVDSCTLIEIGIKTEAGYRKFDVEETVTVSEGSCFAIKTNEAGVA